MSQIPKDEILGYYMPPSTDFICFDCSQTAIKNGSSILEKNNLILKDQADENYVYFCDHCA